MMTSGRPRATAIARTDLDQSPDNMRLTRLGNLVLSRLTGFELIHTQNRNRLNEQSQRYSSIKDKYTHTTKELSIMTRNYSSIKDNYDSLKRDYLEIKSDNDNLYKKNRITKNIDDREKRTLSIIRNFAAAYPSEPIEKFLDLIPFAQSQVEQDIFVISQLGLRPGFFVEFGAANGVQLSNTYLLESKLDWQGILAEPARHYARDLAVSRTAKIDYRCVWKESGHRLKFIEANYSPLSTLDLYKNNDLHSHKRKNPRTAYDVETVSLMDLLDQHGAPRSIDYLSIDTEGSELDIMSNFDFDKYNISIITCEHNHTDSREEIQQILKRNKYRRVFEEFSAWDDWFVRE